MRLSIRLWFGTMSRLIGMLLRILILISCVMSAASSGGMLLFDRVVGSGS